MKSSQDEPKKQRAAALLQAAGELDDALIREAEAEAHARRARLLHRISAVAACLLIAVALIPFSMLLRSFPALDFDAGSAEPPESEGNATPDGEDADGGDLPNDDAYTDVIRPCGTLVYQGTEAGVATFSLTLTSPEALSLSVFVQRRTQNELGVLETTYLYAGIGSTSLPTDAEVLEDALVLTVNGETATALPSAPGEYTLTVDLTALLSHGDGFPDGGEITLSPFGNFPIRAE